MATVVSRSAPTTVYNVSEGDKFNADDRLVAVTCASCGILYAIPTSLDQAARKYHSRLSNGWWLCCPLGHTWGYVGDQSNEARLREQLREERDRAGRLAAERDQVSASLSATKGVVTKQRKKLERVAKGVCPCCTRSFRDLKRHMATKHPEYDGQPQ